MRFINWLDNLRSTQSARCRRPLRHRRQSISRQSDASSVTERLEDRSLLSGLPAFTLQTGTANPLDGEDVGTFSMPALGDLNNDGNLDVIAGINNGTFAFYANTGTATVPAFTEQLGAANPLNSEDIGSFSTPTLGDIDNDGDLDLFTGNNAGTFNFFENTGTVTVPAFTQRTGGLNPLDGQDVGAFSKPALADVDGDGDLEVFAGNGDGTVSFFENTGTVSAPVYTPRTGASNPMDGVDVGIDSTPTLGDVDDDGDLDLIVGKSDGKFTFFENTGTAMAPVFSALTGAANPLDGEDVGSGSGPALGDLDGDNDLDLIVGDGTGMFSYFTATPPPVVLPVVNLSVSTTSGTEDSMTQVTVTATASSAVSGNQTVNLAVTGTDITAGDYTLSGTQITIADGQTQGDVTFTVQDDMAIENLETAILTISTPSSGIELGTTLVQNVAITDNDVAGPTDFTLPVSGDYRVVLNVDTVEIRNSGDVLVGTLPLGTPPILINGTSGNDLLTVDFTGGVPIPNGGLTFNGGDGDDSLDVANPSGSDVAVNYGPAAESGTVDIDNRTVTFTGIESNTLTISGTPANLTLRLTGAADPSVVITDEAGLAGSSRISGSTFVSTVFANPTNRLTVELSTNEDTLTIDEFDPAFSPSNGLRLRGRGGADSINVARLSAAFAGPLDINGQSGSDTVDLGTLAVTSTVHTGGGDLTVKAETVNVMKPVAAGAGNVTIVTNAIDLDGNLSGGGALTIEPHTAGSSIGLGGAPGSLNLDDDELAKLTDGFTAITIGKNPGGTGSIEIESALFNDPVTIAGGTISDAAVGTDITAPAVTLIGNVSPGQSPGSLLVSGDLSLDAAATLTIELNSLVPGTGYDQVDVNGTVDLGGATLNVIPGFTPPDCSVFVIVSNDGADPVVGTFAGLSNGDLVTFAGEDFLVFYNGGDGNDVVLVTGSAALTDVYVDDDWAGTPFGSDPDGGGPAECFGIASFAAIQPALDAVAASGTVHVHPGAYVEALTVTRDVTISGVSGVAADVVIDPPGPLDDGITITAAVINTTLEHISVTDADNGIDSAANGTLMVTNVSASGNTGDGLNAVAAALVQIDQSTFNDNQGHGIDLQRVGDIVTTDVTASGNDPGLFISEATSFSDTDGTYSHNDDHGIRLEQIEGDVILTRTTADNNNADVDEEGDGLHVSSDDGEVDTIGGDLIIRGGRFRDTNGAVPGLHQVNGVYVEALQGELIIDESVDGSGTVHHTEVTGNDEDGVHVDEGVDVAILDGDYSGNAEQGIQLLDVRDVLIDGITSNQNGRDGTRIESSNNISIYNSSFNNNGGDGVELNGVGQVETINVTAEGNDPGIFITNAASFSDTSGTYSGNADHGILLENIAGDVTLVRTTADNNDADNDNTGDGLHARIGTTTAIGGNLRIGGGRFRDTGAGVHQRRGVYVEQVGGTTRFDNAVGPLQAVDVTGNERDGVLILDGGSTGAFIGGEYSENGRDGIDLSGFSGVVTIRSNTITGNNRDAIQIRNSPGNVLIQNVNADLNAQLGADIDGAAAIRVRGTTLSGIRVRNSGAFITQTATVISTKNVDVEVDNGITLEAGLDASDQTIRLAANLVASGNQNFQQNAGGFLKTTNDTANAVVITVNTLLGGTGDARIRNITAGTGAGRITIDAGIGGIRDFDPLNVNLTAAEVLLSGLSGVGVTANPIESIVSRVEGSGGNGGFALSNTGALTLGNVDAGTTGVFASRDVRITTSSPMVVAENVTSGANVVLTSTDGAGAGDDLTVKTTITVLAGADATLTAGDNLLLEDSSTVAAPTGTVFLTGDDPDADPGVGSLIDIFGTITSGSQAVITGGPDDDQITIDPGVTHTVDSTRIDGQDGADLYRVFFGRLTGGASAIDIVDSGTSGNDRGRFVGTPALEETFDITNNDANGVNPQTGGVVLSVSQGEQINYTQTLERFTVRGRSRNDTFNAQPSQTTEITVDGDNPTYGDPGVPPGDTLNFDPLGNTFVLDGKTILTNGGSPDPFLTVNFRDIENLPLNPQGTSTAVSFDFNHSNTASSVHVSPTQTGYVSVLRDTLHSDGLGYGWQDAVTSFERNDGFYSGPFATLIRDGHSLGGDSTFTVDLDNGWYSIDVTLGNAYTSVTGQEIRNADTGDVLATNIDSPPAISTQATFAVLVTDGTLDLEFIQPAGRPDIISVNGLAIRPANLLTMGLNLSGVGSLGADGVTTDTFRLHAAPADSYITVSIDLGQIVNADADPEMDGIQVLTDGNGEADIMILRPSGTGDALVKFVDVNGQGLGCSLLNYVLPDARNFDYNHGAQIHEGIFQTVSPTQAPVATGSFPGGFLGVLGTGLYTAENGFGWLTSPDSFDDGLTLGLLGDLRRDGASSNVAHTFRVDLPPGDYDGLATFGNGQDHDGITLDVNGVNKIAGASTTATSHVQIPIEFTVGGNGIAEFEFSDTVGTAYWVVNGLQIRPRAEVIAFTFTPNVGAVPADGLTIATLQATTLLADGEEVTVSTSAGTIITTDVNDGIEGVQVVVSAGGITFDVLAPGTPATPTLTAISLGGEHNTSITDPALLDFTLAPTRRFDFDHTYSADGTGPSITAAGFIGVLRTDTDPASGHGWLVSPNSFDAGVPNEDDDSLSNAFNVLTTDLYRDYHSGHQVLGSRTFRVQVDSGEKYDGTVYVGAQNFDASTKVTIEGVASATTTNTVAGQFVAVAFTDAMDTDADGFIDIRFENGNGPSPLWATTGIDLVQQGQPLPLPAPVVAADRLEGGHVDHVTQEQIDLAVEIAIAAWEDHGATAEEIALLESTPILVRDFGSNGALGLTTPIGQVVIDDDGSGFGWSPILDVPTGDRYDLLTVIAHEFGHILGRPDVEPLANPTHLMSAYLQRGDRHNTIDGADDFFTAAVEEFLPFE